MHLGLRIRGGELFGKARSIEALLENVSLNSSDFKKGKQKFKKKGCCIR